MSLVPNLPTPGQIARVRQRLYLVEEVLQAKGTGDSSLVRLSCVDDDNQGVKLEVLWDRELNPEVLTGEAWDSIAKKGFDEPRLFAAYFNTLRWNCITATDPKLFQSPFRSGIQIDAYQLEPLRKALLLPRVNLFIADDVGVGKTIEAGLIMREMLLRKRIREIVVSCPPSMLIQWSEELENRFGLTFEIVDKDYMKRIRRERGFATNPWTTHSRFLISHRLLIDEAYAGPLRDWLGTFGSGTLLILDEAHHAAPSSGQKYAIDSQITRAVRDIAPRFEHRLFLSATPHNGHSNSFSALLEILDPQRFCRGVPVTAKHRDEVIVRRLKDDIREIQGGFPKRNVEQIDIKGLEENSPELTLPGLLDQYRELREERLKNESKKKQAASGLLIIGLQQRLLSSIDAFARTLRVHRNTVKKQWESSASSVEDLDTNKKNLDLVYQPLDGDDDRASVPEVDLRAEEESQMEAATIASMGRMKDLTAQDLFSRELELLDQMEEIAENSRRLPDARVKEILRWIKTNLCPDLGIPGAKWNDTRVIIFTEYDDTRRYLSEQLEMAISGSDKADKRIEIYHGPTPPPKREEIKKAFNAPPNKHPVRILIATDAGREGLNLQAHCKHLFHFDVPWNPSRMEQRNGRIDRKLQTSPEVWCYYFYYYQRPEDKILQTLIRKTKTIGEELGSLSQVIDSRLASIMSKGITRKKLEEMQKEIEAADLESHLRITVDQELESARERQDGLRRQIDGLRTLLEKSKESIGLDENHFRSAISCSLELMGAQELMKNDKHKNTGDPVQFIFPALDKLKGSDPTWQDTLDSLRVPKKKEQNWWEWRRESPIRAVVFEDTGTVDDDVVHLHLEHRVVQRLLGRFSAQGFVHHDLSRACLAQANDAIPRIILLGRVCLYGPDAARLHEELIPITARWTDPKIRQKNLTPYAREAEIKTLELLDKCLSDSMAAAVPEQVKNHIKESAAKDISELLPFLQLRGEELSRDAEKRLKERADAESKAMREILERQQKHIQSTLSKHEKNENQLRLDFGLAPEEVRQLEADKRYWHKRLGLIGNELGSEPKRIRDLYEIRAKRIEPVGLVYLWPISG
ncbi:MAG: DISARM system SNF2-like helicase DrmD [Desulfomonilaceae bacterium]